MSRTPLVLPPERRKRRKRPLRRLILALVLVALGILGWLGYRKIDERARAPLEFSGP